MKEFKPALEHQALIDAVAALRINSYTASEIIGRATRLLKGARLLLKDDKGYYNGENNDSIEEILKIVENELFRVFFVMEAYGDPKENGIELSTKRFQSLTEVDITKENAAQAA